MKKACLLLLAIFGFTGLALGQQTCSGDWPEFHNTNMRRENPCETVLNVNNVGSLVLKWSHAGTGGPVNSPVVADGVVYATSPDSSFALNAVTGAVVWVKGGTGQGLSDSPAVAYGALYVGSDDGYVYAVNTHTGSVIWRYATGAPIGSSPTVSNGVVYIGSGDSEGHVYALDARNGTELWSYQTGFFVLSSPAVLNGVLYVSSGNNLSALNANTGAPVWTFPLGGGASMSSPAVADGVAYVGSGFGFLYALDANTGALLWSRSQRGCDCIIDSSPALAYGAVFVGLANTADGPALFAFKARSGAQMWNCCGSEAGVRSSPAVANGVVYFGSQDQNVYAYNARTGALLWRYRTGGPVQSSPVVSNGMVYVGSDDGHLYAFGLK